MDEQRSGYAYHDGQRPHNQQGDRSLGVLTPVRGKRRPVMMSRRKHPKKKACSVSRAGFYFWKGDYNSLVAATASEAKASVWCQ
jgi:hypothetical protein